MEMNDVIQLMDEEGNLIDFSIIANLKVNDTEYAILEAVDSEMEEAVVFRVTKDKGEDILELVTDDDELLTVEEAYYELSSKKNRSN